MSTFDSLEEIEEIFEAIQNDDLNRREEATLPLSDDITNKIALYGLNHVLTISINLPPMPLKNAHGENEINVIIAIKDNSNDDVLSYRGNLPLWTSQHFDIWDLSICLAYMSGQSDTTSRIEDIYATEKNETKLRQYRAHWVLVQSLFDINIHISSKNNKKWLGLRFLSLYFPDGDDDSSLKVEDMECTADAMRIFSDDARHLFEYWEDMRLIYVSSD